MAATFLAELLNSSDPMVEDELDYYLRSTDSGSAVFRC